MPNDEFRHFYRDIAAERTDSERCGKWFLRCINGRARFGSFRTPSAYVVDVRLRSWCVRQGFTPYHGSC